MKVKKKLTCICDSSASLHDMYKTQKKEHKTKMVSDFFSRVAICNKTKIDITGRIRGMMSQMKKKEGKIV